MRANRGQKPDEEDGSEHHELSNFAQSDEDLAAAVLLDEEVPVPVRDNRREHEREALGVHGTNLPYCWENDINEP